MNEQQIDTVITELRGVNFVLGEIKDILTGMASDLSAVKLAQEQSLPVLSAMSATLDKILVQLTPPLPAPPPEVVGISLVPGQPTKDH